MWGIPLYNCDSQLLLFCQLHISPNPFNSIPAFKEHYEIKVTESMNLRFLFFGNGNYKSRMSRNKAVSVYQYT